MSGGRERWEAPYNFTDWKDEFLAFEMFWDIVKDIYMTNAIATTARNPGNNNAAEVGIEPSSIGSSNSRDHDEDVSAKILRTIEGQPAKALDYLNRILHKPQTEKRCLFLLSGDQDFAKHDPSPHVPYADADVDTDSVAVPDTNTTSQTPESHTGEPSSPSRINEQGSSSHTCNLPGPTPPPQPPTYIMAGSGPPDIIPHLDSVYLIPGVHAPVIFRPYEPPPLSTFTPDSAPNPSGTTQTGTPADATGTHEPDADSSFAPATALALAPGPEVTITTTEPISAKLNHPSSKMKRTTTPATLDSSTNLKP